MAEKLQISEQEVREVIRKYLTCVSFDERPHQFYICALALNAFPFGTDIYLKDYMRLFTEERERVKRGL